VLVSKLFLHAPAENIAAAELSQMSAGVEAVRRVK
jgi:hypothetical protein